MEAQLPSFLVRSFRVASHPGQDANDESVYYGPYTRLLYHLFGLEGAFEIQLQFDTVRDSVDIVATFTVECRGHPVMFVQVKSPGTFDNDSKRKEADDQMRDCFLSLRHRVVTPRIPAVSAFGTRLAFYEYVVETNAVTPPAIPADSTFLTDVAPAERWNYDILEADGLARLCQDVQNVIEMCRGLN